MPRSRDIARIVAARFLSRAGSEAAFFIGVWGKAAYGLNGTAAQTALVMLSLGVAGIIGTTIAGVLIDRYGPRRVLASAEVLFVPAALALIAAKTIPQLAILAGIWAFVGSPVMTAGASFAPYLTSDHEELRRVNVWIEGAGSAAFVIGPGVGALIAVATDHNWVFVLDAVTSLAAAVLVWRIPLRAPERVKTDRTPLSELAEGVRVVFGRRGLRYYVLAGTLLWLAFGSFGALEPIFFRDVVGTGIETIGWMNSVFGLGMVAGAALLTRLPRSIISARGAAVAVALTGLGAILYVGWPDLRIIAAGAFVWSVVIGVLEPLLRTLLHRDAPHELVGRVVGTAETLRRVGELVPLAVAPMLAAAFGVQRTLIAGGLITTVVAILSFTEARAIDRSRPTPLPEVEIAGLTAADERISPNP